MRGQRNITNIFVAVGLLCVSGLSGRADGNAERLVQSTTESRTYVYFNATAAAVQKLLPAGWTVAAPAMGALKGANFMVFFVEALAADGADGKPVLNQGKFVVFAVPAKNEQTGNAGAFIVGGFVSQPQAAPGVYGVYAPAKFSMSKSSGSGGPGSTTTEENWDISTDSGDKLRFAVAYERGVGTRGHVEPRVYSAAQPAFYRIYKADQVVDIVHSIPADTKRTTRLEFTGSGPQLSKVFDGKEQLIAVTSIPAYYRQIFLPE